VRRFFVTNKFFLSTKMYHLTGQQNPRFIASMANDFYVEISGKKDGPHDLVTIMRRIRANKIGMDTLIFVDDSPTAEPAKNIPDLMMFFNRGSEQKNNNAPGVTLFTLHSILHDGWEFTMQHTIMSVFSGGIILVSLLLAYSMIDMFGLVVGVMSSWFAFVLSFYMYLAFSLRLYRGQPVSADFINTKLSPVIPTLLLAAFCLTMMAVGGLIVFVIPAFFVVVYYIFVPFFILDRRMNMVQAMYASRLLVHKYKHRYFKTVACLVLAFVGSLILIIPLPLTLPIFAGALIRAYEELSTG